jgi:hypothetical protein
MLEEKKLSHKMKPLCSVELGLIHSIIIARCAAIFAELCEKLFFMLQACSTATHTAAP